VPSGHNRIKRRRGGGAPDMNDMAASWFSTRSVTLSRLDAFVPSLGETNAHTCNLYRGVGRHDLAPVLSA
jgi:hypothetical protein